MLQRYRRAPEAEGGTRRQVQRLSRANGAGSPAQL
jgi:hypothetical protein